MFSLVSNGSPITAEQPQIVPWWSFTKTVLSAAALSLVRDGLIELEDTVFEGPFTLRQLLRHEAGLADYGELADYHAAVTRNDTPWSADEMMQRLDGTRLRYMPGSSWRYSNVGYMYVARLVEHLTDLTLEEALIQRVFAPLGLSSVRVAKTQTDLSGVCLGGTPTYDPGWVYHGLLVGLVAEAALFLDRLLDGHLFSPVLLQEMQAARTLGGPIPGRPWLSPGYGLGLMRGDVEGSVFYGHTGTGPGSVIAVYRCAYRRDTASCAVFLEGSDEGAAEIEAVVRLSTTLGISKRES